MVPYGSTHSERAILARACALVEGAIAALVALSLLLEAPGARPGVHVAVVVAAAALALASLRVGARASRDVLNAGVVLSAALVGAAIAAGGDAATTYGYLLALVVLHACVFQPRRGAVATLALCLVAQVVGVVVADDHSPAVQWLLGPGTLLVGSVLVTQLIGVVRASAADLVAVSGLGRGLHGARDVPTAACEALSTAAGADVTIMLELLESDAGLQVTGMVGTSEAGMVFTAPEVRAALQRCVRTGEEQELPAQDGRVQGLARPVLVASEPVAVVAFAWTQPRRRISGRIRSALLLVAAEAGVALDAAAQAARDREQMMLEVNDTIVQGLAVAKMAIQAGQSQAAVAALDDTLARARDLITQQLDRLAGRGADGHQAGDFQRTSAASVAQR